MKKFLLLIISIFFLYGENEYVCPNPRDYSIRFQTNTTGNIKIIGNINVCKKGDNGKCEALSDNTTNNKVNIMYKDGDQNKITKNSSAAKLILPAGSKVLWAGLYWQGYLYDKNNNVKYESKKVLLGYQTLKEFNSTKLVNYENIYADNYNYVYFNAKRMYYQGFKDITNYVKNHKNGWYWVGNIITSIGKPPGGSYGGWAIALVYQDKNEKLKNLVIYDGYHGIVTQTMKKMQKIM